MHAYIKTNSGKTTKLLRKKKSKQANQATKQNLERKAICTNRENR